MIRIFSKKKKVDEPILASENNLSPPALAQENIAVKTSWLARLKKGLARTRNQFTSSIANLFFGKKIIDVALLEELEAHLLTADIGVEATKKIIADLTERCARKELKDGQAVLIRLQKLLLELIKPCEKPLVVPDEVNPFVILMVGINGAGKTTTIGKLAKYFQAQNKKVMLAAGDTFRAAAIEQLQAWGERNQIPVIAQQSGADSAAVIFDALQAATARGYDILLADTAGRLHTQQNLMEELKKIRRVLAKRDTHLPHEVLLVLDASIGQNAITQAEQFQQAVGVTGIIMTKLDGTAKGGVLFAIAQKLNLPIRFIGIGEAIDDLRIFIAEDFVKALFGEE